MNHPNEPLDRIMMHRTLTSCLVALALSAPATATKFHLGDDNESKQTEGNAEGRVIEGVLLKQDDTTYTIRIVGGEITIAKSSVKKMEEDGLTVAKIEKSENDRNDVVAASETQRRQVQAAEASATREAAAERKKAAPAETERALVIEVDFQGLLPGYTFRTFDPVLGRANLSGLRPVIEDFLRREVKKAAHR